jgi:hypothetical protein
MAEQLKIKHFQPFSAFSAIFSHFQPFSAVVLF